MDLLDRENSESGKLFRISTLECYYAKTIIRKLSALNPLFQYSSFRSASGVGKSF